jgi:hypothetical protein
MNFLIIRKKQNQPKPDSLKKGNSDSPPLKIFGEISLCRDAPLGRLCILFFSGTIAFDYSALTLIVFKTPQRGVSTINAIIITALPFAIAPKNC